MVNPFLRWRREYSRSISQMATLLDVSESTYLRAEQGLYNEIPPTLLRNFSHYALSPGVVRTQYARAQTSRRIATFQSGRVREQFSTDGKSNPFLAWRATYFASRLEFCKAVGVHPSTVKRVEDGIAKTLPEVILQVLLEVGIDPFPLKKEYERWQKNK